PPCDVFTHTVESLTPNAPRLAKHRQRSLASARSAGKGSLQVAGAEFLAWSWAHAKHSATSTIAIVRRLASVIRACWRIRANGSGTSTAYRLGSTTSM